MKVSIRILAKRLMATFVVPAAAPAAAVSKAPRRAAKRARPLPRTIAGLAAISTMLAVTPAQAAYLVSSDENFSYTGSVTGPAGTYSVQPFVSTPGSTIYTGIDAFLLASQSAPAAYSQSTLTNYTDFSPAFFIGNNNPFNSSNGWIGLLDPTNAGVTSATGTWNSTFTTFTLTIDGTQTNPNLSPWSVVGLAAPVNTGLGDLSGVYTNYSLTLAANFASPATLQSPWYSWYSTTAGPTSVTGSFVGTFENTSSTSANNGPYDVNLNFQSQNWAAANGLPDPYGTYFGASTCGNNPGTSCNFVQGTTNTTGTDIGNGAGNGANLSLTNTVVASASTLTPGSGLTCPPGSATCALQTAVGGDGYDGYDNGGGVGGNGGNGTSTLNTVTGRTGTNSVISVGQGGNGGTGGTLGGNGGNGTSSLTLANITSGTSVGIGGDGGWGISGGGTGGTGTAGLTVSGDVTATAVATGGNGGDNYGVGNGGNGGSGITTPVTATGLLATDPVTINVTATGGNGGTAWYLGNGGDGGSGNVGGAVNGISVSTTPGSTGSGPVTIAVQQTGGNGGAGTTDGSGGAAAASTLFTHIVGGVAQLDNVNTINGWTTGPLSIASTATGGNGGDANGTGTAQPGAAGSATLILDQTGLAANQQSSNLQGAAQGAGGNGGNGTSDGTVTPDGAAGAPGTAVANITGYQTVGATANATGGNGGAGNTLGAGGSATATAIATSLTSGFNATAIANATGGSGGTEGEATPLAQAFSIGTGNASATATGTGVLTPGNYATAQSTTTSGTTSVAATANALIGSTEVSQTVTNVGGTVSVLQPATGSYGGAVTTLPASSNMNASIQAQAYGTALPTTSAVIALLDGHPNTLTAFTMPSQVLGVGSLAVANSTSAVGAHDYSASLVYNLTPSLFGGANSRRRPAQPGADLRPRGIELHRYQQSQLHDQRQPVHQYLHLRGRQPRASRQFLHR